MALMLCIVSLVLCIQLSAGRLSLEGHYNSDCYSDQHQCNNACLYEDCKCAGRMTVAGCHQEFYYDQDMPEDEECNPDWNMEQCRACCDLLECECYADNNDGEFCAADQPARAAECSPTPPPVAQGAMPIAVAATNSLIAQHQDLLLLLLLASNLALLAYICGARGAGAWASKKKKKQYFKVDHNLDTEDE